MSGALGGREDADGNGDQAGRGRHFKSNAHVELLLGLNHKCAPSVVANNFKTVTSRLLRKEFPALRAKYREPVLWSRSYFVASVGGAPLSVIRQYIEQQARPL
jgi:putative transposase